MPVTCLAMGEISPPARPVAAIDIRIAGWAAWAEGLEDAAAWQSWAQSPWTPLGESMPALPEVPAMARRRIDRLGRIALQAAFRTAEAGLEQPCVWVSRRGDSQRSFELLSALARGEALSPTGFGLSVHNAIAAQYSMLRGLGSGYATLAAGTQGVEAGLVEAMGLLADGADEVLLVVYEAPVPAAYAGFRDECDAWFGWAWRLQAAGGSGTRLTLSASRSQTAPNRADRHLPAALLPLRHFLAGTPQWRHDDGITCWEWRRHD